MPEYDFQSLSSHDFELLARDLLQDELHVRLESFAKGRDGGVDFRFRNATGDLVVQCKHYSDYDDLIRVLKRHEVEKVRRLKPVRYVLAVSVSLTPLRKDELTALFAPYCQGPSDVFGREDLNNLLGVYSNTERKHFKLWLTSEAVLTRVLHAGIWGDSDLTVERIRKRASRYVPNRSLGRARQILDEHHYCIVAGIPGIGKTTLAEILLIEFVDRHGFEAVRVANDLSEIKDVKNPGRRQIFYFDDFLGTTALDKLQKNEDQRLTEFMAEVAGNANWRFILTTREYILNAARIRHEALAYPSVDLTPCIIELADYTRPIRARILYNHIFFSDLSNAYKRVLLEDKRYEKILQHRNYNPRIIEHMTQARHAESSAPEGYFENFLQNLQNPTRIWDHAFRSQLTEAAQHVLLVMGSLPDEILLADLEAAFNTFYKLRRAKLGFAASSRDFENALKELDGNFIKTTLNGRNRIVTLHNPSVADFIESYLACSPGDVADLIEGAHFFDQFMRLWRGQRGNRFGGVEADRDKFIRTLAARFAAPTCGLTRTAERQALRHGEISFEARLSFAVELAADFKSPESRSIVDQLLSTLQTRIAAGSGHKDDLVQLLRKLDFQGVPQVRQTVFVAAKNYLTQVLDEPDDFVSVGAFIENFPKAFTESELASVREAFCSLCENYDDSWADSPADLEYVANQFERVAAQLELGSPEVCGTLMTRAEEWWQQLRDEEREYEDPDEDSSGADRMPEDIDGMFEGLLGEINEKE
jgi:Restriction endonuclease